MPKPGISSIKGKFSGRPAAILGPAPSLFSDLSLISADNPVLIAVNYHIPLHSDIPVDFMVFIDHPDYVPGNKLAIGKVPAVVTPHRDFSTYVMDVHYIHHVISAGLGCWLAELIGAEQILLCGMDCYQGAQRYFHSDKTFSPFLGGLARQFDLWRAVEETLSTPIHAISGPLTEKFPGFRRIA